MLCLNNLQKIAISGRSRYFYNNLVCLKAKVLKKVDLLLPYLSNTYNWCIFEDYSHRELQSGDISFLFKKDEHFNKKNYRLIAVLSSVSEIFKALMYEQVIPFAKCLLSPLQCGFRKGSIRSIRC